MQTKWVSVELDGDLLQKVDAHCDRLRKTGIRASRGDGIRSLLVAALAAQEAAGGGQGPSGAPSTAGVA
jgi:metal-responsive CopG/Arc/MetJ family transcriptional regulator